MTCPHVPHSHTRVPPTCLCCRILAAFGRGRIGLSRPRCHRGRPSKLSLIVPESKHQYRSLSKQRGARGMVWEVSRIGHCRRLQGRSEVIPLPQLRNALPQDGGNNRQARVAYAMVGLSALMPFCSCCTIDMRVA